jgi:hypothetical protein
MHLKSLITAWLILSGFVLSGATCTRVVIEDHEICGDKGSLGASCFHLLSDGRRKVDPVQWEKERFGQLCMKDEAFANFKAALLKLCDETQRCTWQEKEELQSLVQTLEDKIALFQSELP